MLNEQGKNTVNVANITIELPNIPSDIKLIAGWNLPKEEQMWRRTELPEIFKKLPKTSPHLYLKDEHWDFIDQEFERRENGYWFFNNGVPTYITGTHYFYINWWKIDIGYPRYRDVDRDYFYFWMMCENDTNSYGMMEATRRRQGKSFRGGCLLYEFVSRMKNAQGGIQSKTNVDAVKLFSKSVVSPWRSLPFFFKPVFDNTSNPKKELRFFAPARKGSKINSEIEEDELQSTIDCQPSGEMQYDGQKLHRYMGDEIGKPSDANVETRWEVVKKCLQVDGEIIGKALLTSTVEELSPGAGNEPFENLWKDSNYFDRGPNGQTVSGLYRYFQPAYMGYKLDKYGNSLIEESKQDQLNTFESLRKNPKKLASEKRKMPWTEDDMFRIDSSKCHFDSLALQTQLDRLNAMSTKPYVCGNFEWINNVKNTKVEFVACMHDAFDDDGDCPVCRWRVSYLPDESMRNNVIVSGFGGFSFYQPKNQVYFSAGCDPYQNKIVLDESKASNAALYVRAKYNPFVDTDDKPLYDHKTAAPCVEYIYRPADIYAFYDDVIKTCWFYGCEIFPETNKIGLKYWLQENGYQDFLVIKPEGITKENDALRLKQDGGANSTQPMISHYTDLIEYDVIQNVHKYPFPRLIKNLLRFDNSQTQKYDPSVAWGYTLVGCEKRVKPKDVSDDTRFIQLYDEFGNPIDDVD